MTKKNNNLRNQHKLRLTISVVAVFAAAFVLAQLMFAPNMVQTVYAGSTLTPTSVPIPPTATPVPPTATTVPPTATTVPPTATPVSIPPTNTPQSSSTSTQPTPTPEPTSTPPVPENIPELGGGSILAPLLLTLLVLISALFVAGLQVYKLLKEADGHS